MWSRCLTAVIGFIVFSAGTAAQRQTPPPDARAPLETRASGVRYAESSLRTLALSSPMPVYPESSVGKRRAGVAVAAILIGFTGAVEEVDVLEAPDEAIASSVRDALRRWTFKPTHVGSVPDPWKARGKLTFYFRLEGRGGVVLNPEAAAVSSASAGGGVAASARRAMPQIDESECRRLLQTGEAQLVDIAERRPVTRSALGPVLNIPSDELAVRAGSELSRAKTIVIDCQRDRIRPCGLAAETLREHGFPKVVLFVHD